MIISEFLRLKESIKDICIIQEVESPVCRTKDQAKAIAALQACSQLLNLKAFDNHLMPKNIRKEILGEMAPQYDENGLIIGSRRRHGLYEKRTPKLWKRVVEEEEEEEVGIEDNPDLLRATAQPAAVEKDAVVENGNGDAEKEIETAVKVETIPMENGNSCESNIDSDLLQLNVSESQPPQPNNDSTEAMELTTVIQKSLEYEVGNVKMLDLDAEITPEETKELEVDHVEEELSKVELDGEEELEEGPFHCWFTIIEVQMKDNQFEGIPYRRLCLVSKRPFPDLPELKLFHKSQPFIIKMRNLSTEIILQHETIQLLSDYMLKLMLALINKEFRCPINEIPYYIVPLLKNTENSPFESLSPQDLQALIDWDEINKIIEHKISPYVLNTIEDASDTIVIDNTDNNRRYFVTKLRTDMSPLSPVPADAKIREAGYATFAEFYKTKKYLTLTNENQPMLEVRRLKKVMNFLYPGQTAEPKVKGPTSTWTVPEFCSNFFMSASVYQATMMIPSIMTRVDSILLCREAKIRYDLPIDDTNFLEAYTCPSASMEMNYERLETLGGKL